MTPPYEISVALPELLTFERNNKDFFIGIDLGVQETVFIQSNLLGRTPLGNGQVSVLERCPSYSGTIF